MVSTTIAFKQIDGPHNAETFAEMLEDVFEEYGILHKVSFLLYTYTRFYSDLVNTDRLQYIGQPPGE